MGTLNVEENMIEIGHAISDIEMPKLISMPSLVGNWEYDSFDGGSAGMGAAFTVGGGAGLLTLKENGKKVLFKCLFAETSVGLVPIPGNINASGKSGGEVVKLPKCSGEISKSSFKGPLVMISGATGMGLNIGASVLFFGATTMEAAIGVFFTGAQHPGLMVSEVVRQSQVAVVTAGLVGNVMPDIGMSISLGVSYLG